ncbi:MAG: CopG family transcriptional regulator [Methylococcaceae bacterium]
MATEAFTIRAETNIVHKLDNLAGSLDRPRNFLVNQAIKAYLETNTLQIEKITQGIAAVDWGELIAHEDVMSEMEDIIERKAK